MHYYLLSLLSFFAGGQGYIKQHKTAFQALYAIRGQDPLLEVTQLMAILSKALTYGVFKSKLKPGRYMSVLLHRLGV
eukprot:scaffold14646_cov21-Prasinocladus_malaysianus.AAC.1